MFRLNPLIIHLDTWFYIVFDILINLCSVWNELIQWKLFNCFMKQLFYSWKQIISVILSIVKIQFDQGAVNQLSHVNSINFNQRLILCQGFYAKFMKNEAFGKLHKWVIQADQIVTVCTGLLCCINRVIIVIAQYSIVL